MRASRLPPAALFQLDVNRKLNLSLSQDIRTARQTCFSISIDFFFSSLGTTENVSPSNSLFCYYDFLKFSEELAKQNQTCQNREKNTDRASSSCTASPKSTGRDRQAVIGDATRDCASKN